MNKNKRQSIRESVGFTFDSEKHNPNNWFSRAESFKEAAVLISESNNDKAQYSKFYNMAISIELLLKAVSFSLRKEPETTHKLCGLVESINLKLSNNAMKTLELLSSEIEWAGRYPTPKNDKQWNEYHNNIQNKHIIRTDNGVFASKDTFPTLDNFLNIWCEIENKFNEIDIIKHP
ncbi:HEPN domain-containing protein [Photobacterium kishitanii]|uniref:HEPN domain-containing protein n=1 Tax=Photobacterium kishitanii TaxID=318456 RepID=UPI00071AF109|nr:HEPN domain-containing protein [Photobacterium kishitanii]